MTEVFDERHAPEASHYSSGKRRAPWAAFLLSLLFTGLGQFYNRQFSKAAIFLIVGILIDYVLIYYVSQGAREMWITIFLGTAINLSIAIEALLSARRLGAIKLSKYQSWPVYIGILLIGGLLSLTSDFHDRFKSFKVPSGSMLPSLLIGDRFMARTDAYEKESPQRGDLIVFYYPKDPTVYYVKRIVALPGDEVSMQDKVLSINGKPMELSPLPSEQVDHALAHIEMVSEKPYRRDETQFFIEHNHGKSYTIMWDDRNRFAAQFPKTKIPEANYFVMGDNRDNSNDSRFWGFVPEELILGRAHYIFLHFNGSAQGEQKMMIWDRIGVEF